MRTKYLNIFDAKILPYLFILFFRGRRRLGRFISPVTRAALPELLRRHAGHGRRRRGSGGRRGCGCGGGAGHDGGSGRGRRGRRVAVVAAAVALVGPDRVHCVKGSEGATRSNFCFQDHDR